MLAVCAPKVTRFLSFRWRSASGLNRCANVSGMARLLAPRVLDHITRQSVEQPRREDVFPESQRNARGWGSFPRRMYLVEQRAAALQALDVIGDHGEAALH